MVKGFQKEIVVIKMEENSKFEYAYLVIKDGIKNEKESDDIMKEADKIIKESVFESVKKYEPSKSRKVEKFFNFLLFLSGFLLGAGICGLIFMLIY